MSKTFRLAKKTKVEDFVPKTHAGSVVLALAKIGSGSTAEILAEVNRQRRIKTTMSRDKAVSWITFDLVRRGYVVSGKARKTPTAKAA